MKHHHKTMHDFRISASFLSMIGFVLGATACKDLTAKLPAGYVNPATYASSEAAVSMGRNVRYQFQETLFTFVQDAGLIADELFYWPGTANQRQVGFYISAVVADSRYLPDLVGGGSTGETSELILDGAGPYKALQQIRARAALARLSLQKYANDSTALQGEVAAYEGFATMMLADLYCSGVPLSTIEFEGDFRYQPGSRTIEIYEHAITLFDVAMNLAGSDTRVRSLAAIGKGRALLALGQVQDAASAVGGVAQGYLFALPLLKAASVTASLPNGINWTSPNAPGIRTRRIANLKGGNGMDFLSAKDPRIRTVIVVSDTIPAVQTHLLIADATEATLIIAEAKLHTSDPQWLDMLNALRTDGTFVIAENGDTVYGAGQGGVANLPPLSDPGLGPRPANVTEFDARIDLLMRERAFWLFFRGIRQGDLRRLIRHYGRTMERVYPQGVYPMGTGSFEQYVDMPVPTAERPNPYFTGCLVRGE